MSASADIVARLSRDFLLFRDHAPVYRVSDAGGLVPADGSGEPVPEAPLEASIAIGVFDGLHRGHRQLLDACCADARARGVASVAVTFDPDPDVVVSTRPALRLLARRDRIRALSASGVDYVVIVPFTPKLAALDHAAFFDAVLAPVLRIESVHVGSDFRLGARGASTVPVIRRWFAQRGVDVFGHDLVREEGAVVSATRIRSLLAAGELDAANGELGRCYFVSGTVVHGRGQGTGMGFPTANVSREEPMQMPADGVYAGWALAGDTAWPAAVNVGLPPMFASSPESATLEATLLGFSGDLYGSELSVLFSKRLRGPISFSSLGELIAVVKRDMETTRRLYGDDGIKLPVLPDGLDGTGAA